ncbi:hypothetical protein OF846_000693 [Rhodotorula toruloides]|nr:hypothetical protein OF846_000693 [Rhodotorula toruloides]
MFAGNGGGGGPAAVAGPSHGQMRASYAPTAAQGHYERPAYAEHAGFTQSLRPGSRAAEGGALGQMGSGSAAMQDGPVQSAYGGTQQGQVQNPGHPQRPPSVVVSSNPYGPQASPHTTPRGQNVAPSPHMQHQQHQQQMQARQQQQSQPDPSPHPPHTPYSHPAPSPYSNSPATYPQPGPSPYQQHPHPPQRQQQPSGPFPSHPSNSQATYAPPHPNPSPTRPHHLSPHAPHPAHEISPNPHARQLSYPQPPAQHPPHAQPQQASQQQQRDFYSDAENEEMQRRRAHAHADAVRARLARRPEQERRFASARQDEEVVPVSAPLQTIGNGYTAVPVQQQQSQGMAQHHAQRAVPQAAEPFDLHEDEDQRLRFHAYLLDYLQKAGFLSTAAALLSDSPSIPTHSPSSGRSYVLPRPRLRQATSGNSSLFFTSPSALSPLPLGPPPSQPISPRKDTFGADAGPTNADTVESTASTASTATHFGFDGSGRGATDDEDGAPSPAKDASGPGSPSKRTSQANSRNISGSSTGGEYSALRIPAAKVQIETDQGFLYEWWNVFWDVFRAKASAAGRNANPAAARSFVQASSAAVDVAMQRQANAHAQARSQAQAHQAHVQAQAQAQGRRPSFHAGAQPPPQRRPSVVAQPTYAQDPQQQHPPSQPNAPRPPIPLRQPDNPSIPSAQPEPAIRSVREPSAPTDEVASTPGGTRRSSRHKSAMAHAQALQRQQEQQAEINARMAQARVHAQQIHSRHVLPHSPSVGTPGTPASTGQATSPVQSFSPNALNYNPDRLQQTTEAYNRYRASLVASQQTQLEMAKRQLSKDKDKGRPRRASSAAAEGSMPPPPTTQRTSTSLDNTPRNKDLPLPPTPSASGASAEAAVADKAGENAASPAGTASANVAASKRRRSSMANSISETRESKKRVTQQPSASTSADQPPAPAVITVLPPEISAQLAKEPLHPGGLGTLQGDTADAIQNYLASDPSTSVASLDAIDGLSGLDSDALGLGMSADASGQLSLEQLDRLLSSTVDAAGAPYSSSTDVQLGDSATFDYNEFLTAFGSEGPASYDPTVQTFDLAV